MTFDSALQIVRENPNQIACWISIVVAAATPQCKRSDPNSMLFATDQRTASATIFGAICPKDGKGAALVLPRCDTEAMNLHLAEIAAQIAPGAHAALLVDQAGWHLSGRLIVPNITMVPFCPELNPEENVWQFMRDNWLSNRLFISFDDIVDHCCEVWNKLIDQPWKIMSIGLRDWAHRS
jgi:DDE superfamily endonuclease